MKNTLMMILITILSVGFLAACGGGGGGGSGASPDPIVSEPVVPDPIVPDPIVPDPVVSEPVVPDPVVPDPVVSEPVVPDPVVPDPVVPSSSSANPRLVVLPPPNPSDGVNYETAEYNRSSLSNIKASAAYERGYFGQGVTVGVIDSGIRTTHTEFTGRIVPGYNFTDGTTVVSDADGHGTGVAGIIGAAMDSSEAHGVAPSVSLMPLQVVDEGGRFVRDRLDAFEFAVSARVPILNNSYGYNPTLIIKSPIEVTITVSGAPITVAGRVRFIRPRTMAESSLAYASEFAKWNNAFQDEDMVLVWAAGNEGWNEVSGRLKFLDVLDASTGNLYFPRVRQPVSHVHDEYGLTVGKNLTGDEGYAPIFQPGLLGKWVNVVATDTNDRIASFSNACAESKYWCLAAPGVSIYTPDADADSAYRINNGTSFAAPYVSGALAVLRSRYPDMPMDVIVAIMFKTATDLGAPGVDDVYGHGLLNLEAAITVQGNTDIYIGTGTVALRGLAGTNGVLGDGFSELKQYMGNAQVAVGYRLGDDTYYYDTPLSGLVTEHDAAPQLGRAAADMFGASQAVEVGNGFSAVSDKQTGQLLQVAYDTSDWHFSYDVCDECERSAWHLGETFNTTGGGVHFAEDEQNIGGSWQFANNLAAFSSFGLGKDAEEITHKQVGLRWDSGRDGTNLLAEVSQITEDGSLLGSEGALFGIQSAKTYQGRLGLSSQLGDWSMLGGYRYGMTDAKVDGSGLIASADLQYSLWHVELLGRSLLLGEDELRFSVEGHPATRGKIGIRHSQAGKECNFVKDTGTEGTGICQPTEVKEVTTTITEAGEAALTWRLGYKFSPIDKMDTALGLEYHAAESSDKIGASLQLNWKLY